MKIYLREMNDNLAQAMMDGGNSIAFECDILSPESTALYTINNYEQIVAQSLKSAKSFIEENKEVAKQKDLYYLNSVLVSAGWNKNDDVFGVDELWEARDTPVNKQFNYMHDDTDIIGHITASMVVDHDGNPVKQSDTGELPDKIDIITSSVIYKTWSDKQMRERIEEYLETVRPLLSSYPLKRKNWDTELKQLPALMTPGEAHFIQDEPVSFDGKEHRLVDMLDYLAAPSHKELIMVTPYLIPVRGFLEDIAQLSSEGVKVKIITGSMGSNNHTIAHSHYKKYRRRILATGAELFEFRHDPSPAMRDVSDVSPVESKFISLHIKALVGDRKRCFIGSLNLDPRAIEINTENGLYIESVGLAEDLAKLFDIMMAPENAWRVYLNSDDHLRWESESGTVSSQPARSFGQRIADFFFRLIPIEKQL